MKKIKVLEVNNIDLPGKVFNGYDMIKDLSSKQISIKQAVIIKQSNNKDVVKILNTDEEWEIYQKLVDLENNLSIQNLLSITSPLLRKLDEYKEAEIIHFHMFHNTKLSIPSLLQISREKKVIITLHDPWFLTGRCVHFYDCNKWKNGCNKCEHLDTLFHFTEDNCSNMWNVKKEVFNNVDIDIVVSSKWMQELLNQSPIFKNNKNVHLIPFGINIDKYKENNKKNEIREKLNIDKSHVVLFLRSQKEFKGTEFVLEALKQLETKQSITILTCSEKGLLDEVKEKYNIIELGNLDESGVIDAMNACDIFLMPSKAESFGMMAVEAMACARPVIVFENTALPTVTFATECGLTAKDRDAYDLMKKMKSLIEDKEERTRRGKLGRKYCEKYYSYVRYNTNLKQLYLDLHNKPYKVEKYHKKIDKDMYNNYLDKVSKYIKTGEIDKTINFSKPMNLEIVNMVNEKICDEIYKTTKITFKSKIKLLLNKSKIFKKIYSKIRRR